MVPDITIPVERFHRVLVDEIQKQRPTYLETSFTVAEIYQILVPYRSHRDALGVEMNGDYEDALLRLLAGAGDLVVLESDDARDRILLELQSKNPNTGLFREFAGAGVHLKPEALPESVRAESPEEPQVEEPQVEEAQVEEPQVEVELEPASPAVEAAEEAESGAPVGIEATYFDFETSSIESMDADTRAATPGTPGESTDAAAFSDEDPEDKPDIAPTISLVSATEATSSEPGAGFWKPGEHPVNTTTTRESRPKEASRTNAATRTEAASATADTAECSWCDESLPERADVNFCPHCGVNTSVKPCGGCRSEVEPSWKFCISCGEQVPAAAS